MGPCVFAAMFAAAGCAPDKGAGTDVAKESPAKPAAAPKLASLTESALRDQNAEPAQKPSNALDEDLREKAESVAVYGIVYGGKYNYVKSPDGALRPLDPLKPMSELKAALPAEYRKLTLEERLKDPEFQKQMRFTVPDHKDDSSSLFHWFALPTASAGGSSLPNNFTLAAQQTGIRDQDGRGTCVGFSNTAGLEAAYRRIYGMPATLNLSEQFLYHMEKGTYLSYPSRGAGLMESATSYWWGSSTWSMLTTMLDYTIPEESYAPYKTQADMDAFRLSVPEAGTLSGDNVTQANIDAFEYSNSYITPAARANAKYGVTDAVFLSQSDCRNSDTIETFLNRKQEVIADFDLKWKYNSTTGVNEYCSTCTSPGGHSMLIIGYDRRDSDPQKQFFILKNSWGGSSYYKVSYTFVRNTCWDAGVINSVRAPSLGTPAKANWIGTWKMDHDGWQGRFIVRRTTNRNNSATRLGTWFKADGTSRATMNGYFVNDGRGVVAYMSPTSENAPGTLSGQPFYEWLYSWDPGYVAGYTVWNNIQFGSFMSRNTVAHPGLGVAFTPQSWVGGWNLDYDGWIGDLYIDSINTSTRAISGRFFLRNGTDKSQKTVAGTYDATNKHIGHLTIGGQPFTLYRHTWESGFLSGYTVWSANNYGAHGIRK